MNEVAGGLWAPVRISSRLYNKSPPSPLFGTCMGTIQLTVMMRRSRFNGPVDPKLFDMQVPPGTEVEDLIRRVVYIEKGSEPER